MSLIDVERLCEDLDKLYKQAEERGLKDLQKLLLDYITPITVGQPTVDAVEVVRCKDCKHFTLDLVENVDGVPLIVAHEVCDFWGDGCKTSHEGFCSYGVRKDEVD